MTKIKICGITNLEDALVAVETGADLLGFIFYEPSPRYVTPERAREIVAEIRSQESEDSKQKTTRPKTQNQITNPSASLRLRTEPDEVTSHQSPTLRLRSGQVSNLQSPKRSTNLQSPITNFIGVFVNSPLQTVAHIFDYCQLDAAQLHGEESPEFVNHFAGRAFKALRPQSQAEADSLIRKYLPCAPASPPPCFLIDAYHPTLYGGAGQVTDWTMAANIARRYPIMLAGGLTPANVAEAIRAGRPWGVDVSSGVEVGKGRKDHGKVREFVEAVKRIKRRT